MRLSTTRVVLLALAVCYAGISSAVAEEKAKAAPQVTMGTLKSVTDKAIVLTDKDNKDWTYRVAENVFLTCPESKDAKVADLKPGDQASILWFKKGEGFEAGAILHHDGPFKDAALAAGKAQKVEDAQITIANAKGKEWTYTVDDAPHLRLKNKQAKLSSFKAGDEVVFVYAKQGNRFKLLSMSDCPKQ